MTIGSEGTIHIVGTTGEEIYYKKSTDGGETWAMASRVSWTTGRSEFPVIAIDSRNTENRGTRLTGVMPGYSLAFSGRDFILGPGIIDRSFVHKDCPGHYSSALYFP
jgi:hypothetical protein